MALKPAQMATNLPAYQREAVHDKSVSQSVNPPVSQSVSRSISQLVSVAENAWYSRGNTINFRVFTQRELDAPPSTNNRLEEILTRT